MEAVGALSPLSLSRERERESRERERYREQGEERERGTEDETIIALRKFYLSVVGCHEIQTRLVFTCEKKIIE